MIRREKVKGGDQVKVTFTLPVGPDGADGPIGVAGDFNGWDPAATPLRKRKDQRSASVALDPGRHYAFRYVTADGQWFNDPAADRYEKNEFGGDNCVIDLTDQV